MRKAYIILAHKNPDQLKRLIDRLYDDDSDFFIHIDKNSALAKDKPSFMTDSHILVLPAIKTDWGSMGLVNATLNALAAIKHTRLHYERVILLSGQDYPIKSNKHIDEFFEASGYTVFMNYCAMPNYKKWGSGGGSYRFNKYFFGFSFFYKYAAKAINFSANYITALERNLTIKMDHFHGSQWWIVDMYTLNYILDFVKDNPGFSSFHKYTFAPDELFFQTILLNSSNETLLKSISNDNVRYMKWAKKTAAHPQTLLSKDFEDIANSPALFARKFDTGTDAEVLNMIDNHILITDIN